MQIRYAKVKNNDTVNGEHICVSLFMQGCPHHCKGCWNPETWDFEGGETIEDVKLIHQIVEAINKNGIQRNFSVLGGEPLCEQNIKLTSSIVQTIRTFYPNIKIFIWTGYTLEELLEAEKAHKTAITTILNNIDVLIDGPFIQEQRDLSLPLRGSKNQRILYKGKDF